MIYLLKTLSVVLLLSVSALEVEIVRGARRIAKQDPGAKLSPVRRSIRHTISASACFNNPVGVGNPCTGIIPDSQMTASSEVSVLYQSAYGRLRSARGHGWCAGKASTNDQWLQVDLGKLSQVCGLATQGEANAGNEWVTAFKLSYSYDGKIWKTYRHKNGTELEFHRKGKSDGIDRHKLPVPVSARFFRFNPTQRHHWNCLRVEIYSTLPIVSQTVSRNLSITAVAHCTSLIKSPRQNFYKVDATTTQKGLMCRVLTRSIGDSLVYIVSAELLNQAGWQGIHSGHLGLLFNAVDENNFDFVYFRPQSASSCYQTGYMAKGNLNLVESKACPKGPPKGGVWFPVSVKVHGQNVQVYLSGDLVATVKSHFAPRARGGVLTFNGYKNVILFRKFQIAPQMYSSKRCGKVVEIPDRAKLLKLVADHGAWPQDSFCQVIYLKDAGKSRNYQLSVDLFNFIGQGKANYGHPGVFFNAEDEDNYDFVYFRPHSANGCYQTGYVYKGQPKFDGAKTSTCPSGPPKGAEWFHVKVTVSTATPAGEVKVYLNGKLVTSWNPRYPIKNRGGVLVANGYKNVVYYKNFHIQ